MNRKPQVGDLIQWSEGQVGVLVERFDLYQRAKLATRNYSPRWCWHIVFFGPIPISYNTVYGVSEATIMRETLLKILNN